MQHVHTQTDPIPLDKIGIMLHGTLSSNKLKSDGYNYPEYKGDLPLRGFCWTKTKGYSITLRSPYKLYQNFGCNNQGMKITVDAGNDIS